MVKTENDMYDKLNTSINKTDLSNNAILKITINHDFG